LAGEGRVCDFLAATLARLGLDTEQVMVAPQRPNLLARLTPRGRVRCRVVLAPHLDTVGGAPDQFVPRERCGRIHGRGACDTKGSLAAMATVLAQLARNPARPAHTEIVLAALVDEECGQVGSRALARSGLKADLAIVGEPTRLQVVTAHKGSLWLELKTHGKAAHGATPQFGRNAVHTMARVVNVLETEYARQLRRRRHPLLGCATISVGTIRGGVQTNIVPEACRITADRRTLPGESEAGVRRKIQTLLRRRGLTAAIADTKAAPCPPLESNPRLPLVEQLMRCARQTEPVGVHFFCDAAVLAAGGIPSVVFGPGDIAQAHTADEWVSVRSLERAIVVLARFLQSLP
jgi:acetylornithine deacetylase/succinyl-diaminopimelate desuccinylase-like protein